MREIAAVAIAVCLVGAAGGTASAEIYRWTDAEGREHFSTDLSRVPRSRRPEVRRAVRAPAGAASRPVARPPAKAAPRKPAANADLRDGHDRAWWSGERARLEREIRSLERSAQVCQAPGNEPCSIVRFKLDARRAQLAHFEDRVRHHGVPRAWLR